MVCGKIKNKKVCSHMVIQFNDAYMYMYHQVD